MDIVRQKIGNVKIYKSDQVKLLGLTIKFGSHVTNICLKAKQKL